jgi:hypothetical protein
MTQKDLGMAYVDPQGCVRLVRKTWYVSHQNYDFESNAHPPPPSSHNLFVSRLATAGLCIAPTYHPHTNHTGLATHHPHIHHQAWTVSHPPPPRQKLGSHVVASSHKSAQTFGSLWHVTFSSLLCP